MKDSFEQFNDEEKRIYVGDCGCVRIETKHFRVTFQAGQFVEMLREIVAKQKLHLIFSKRFAPS